MILPEPCGIMTAPAARASTAGALTLTAMTSSQTWSLCSRKNPAGAMPALLTTISSRPKRSTALLDETGDGRRVLHVALHREDLLRRRCLQLLQFVQRARCRQHFDTLLHQGAGRRMTQTAACAGHDGDIALEAQVHHGTSSVSCRAIPSRSTSEAPS